MKKTVRLIVKIKLKHILIDNVLRFRVKEDMINDYQLKNYHFIPAMPDSFVMKLSNNNNKLNTENLLGIYYVDLKKEVTDEQLNKIIKKLSLLPYFEYVQKISEVPPPTVSLQTSSYDTPDFTYRQTYKNGFMGNYSGIDMEYAWSLGIAGQGIRIADIEWGFNFDHIDLKRESFIQLIPLTRHEHDYHGTGVAGVLYAKDNGFGVTGMVHDADVLYGVTEYINGDGARPTCIAIGLEQLRAGDVFLFEMQEYHGEPADYNKAVWDMIKVATDAGIIIVATAGNGNWDLDSEQFAEYRSWGDNGVIMVGAGTAIGRNRCNFSNYGTMVHVQGWGDWSVVTTGGGNLYNGLPDGDNDYTNTFSGTSAAGPIVTSAVVAIQSWYKRETNNVLYPEEMRNLLIETGLAQGNEVHGHIGPLPNIRNAIEKLEKSITYFNVINNENIYANEINSYLNNYQVVIINFGNGNWSNTTYIPAASGFNMDKRIYINNYATLDAEVYFNFSSTPVVLETNESISLVSDGEEWNVR
ncbi:S8 family serine peptidase [Providencia sp. PROV152]|uniref:S8 family serine peptidase n=1 Tax=Providencia stuartii TaxID=588 RepID=A0AAI9I302_PROST|nr:S8 family serine peptidase [Providencia sp. PROV152]ELR5037712.1 S8 family serine peptidase [Providencia stuartii]